MEKEEISKLGKKITTKKIKDGPSANEVIFNDVIPSELLLTITLNDRIVSTISCSPINIIEFTIGYLVNNGYADRSSDIDLIKICGQELSRAVKHDDLSILVEVKANLPAGAGEKEDTESNFYKSNIPKFISSACGSMDDLILGQKLEKIKSANKFDYKAILRLNTEAAASQRFKKAFGGLHSAALFDSSGNLIVLMEDIGRHNCIDKIAGFMQIKKIKPSDKIVYTTGRISIDVIFKIAKMNICVLVSNSSVTHSAALLAKKINLTVIGYARGGRFNIYSFPKRIVTSQKTNHI